MTGRPVIGVVAAAAMFTAAAPAMSGGAAACVTVVVDFGELAPDDEPSVACVDVEPGADGSATLAARAEELGTTPPRYDGSGLLCAIDGLPDSGCGEQAGDRYRYWSYWLGEAEWAHASVGPAFREAEPAVVEGWHFVEGSGRPGDPPPSVTPVAARAMAESAALSTGGPTDPALEVSARSGGDGDDSSYGGLVAGLVVLGGLATAGGFVARRRRREA